MRCKTAERYIMRQLDRELSPKHHKRLSEHLNRCSFCKKLEGEYQSLGQMMAQLPDVEFPEFLHHRIMSNLPKRSRRTQAMHLRLSLAVTSLSIVLSIAAGALVGLKGFEDSGIIAQSITEEESGQLLFGENSIMVVSYDE